MTYHHKRYTGELLDITYDQDVDTDYAISIPEKHIVRDTHLTTPLNRDNMSEIQAMQMENEGKEGVETIVVHNTEVNEVRVRSLMTMSRASALQWIMKQRVGEEIAILDSRWNDEKQAFYMVVEHIKTTEEEAK